MSDEQKPAKPDPIEDVRKGLGLLFRAAKSAVEQLPTRKLEDVVVTGAREVGRAIENVTQTIDREIFHREPPRQPTSKTEAADKSGTNETKAAHDDKGSEASSGGSAPTTDDDGNKRPRVG